MSPFRVARQQTGTERVLDIRAWYDLGVPLDQRVPVRTNLCTGTLRGATDMPCCQWAQYQKDGRGYCRWHRPAGAERR